MSSMARMTSMAIPKAKSDSFVAVMSRIVPAKLAQVNNGYGVADSLRSFLAISHLLALCMSSRSLASHVRQ